MFIPFAALFIYFAIENTNNMNNGEIYTTYFDIPAQYLYYFLAGFIFIAGIVSFVKHGDDK